MEASQRYRSYTDQLCEGCPESYVAWHSAVEQDSALGPQEVYPANVDQALASSNPLNPSADESSVFNSRSEPSERQGLVDIDFFPEAACFKARPDLSRQAGTDYITQRQEAEKA